MSESSRPVPVPRRSPEADDRLDSWKEIAAYLGREVRTVQGWEKNESLPIHRHQHARQGSVYAFKAELDAWREARKESPELPANVRRIPVALLAGVAAAIVVVLAIGFFIWKNRSSKPAGPALSSVVVLPFLDLSPQKDQDYFSDGLTEEIIDALSRVPNLRVVARTSAFAFKGKAIDIRKIGDQLNVSAVLEGSVRKSGDQLRITAQLNRVSDGTHLWSRTYDRQLRDVFAVQSEISQAIADQLRAGQVPQRKPTADLEAYRFYQEGRYLFYQFQPPDSNHKAIERYEQAIQRDPKFALTYSGLADAYAYLAEDLSVPSKEVMPKAKEAAEKAVALDDNLGEAHISLGIVRLDYEWDREGAEREFRRAIQLNPSSAWAHHWRGHLLEAQGRLDDAMKEMRFSQTLDPLALAVSWDITNELILAKRYDEAIREADKARELFPQQPLFPYFKAKAYYGKGDNQSAHTVVESMKTMPDSKTPLFIGYFGVEAVHDGRRAEAERVLAELEHMRATQYVDAFAVTDLCMALGDHECLVRWFKRAHEDRSALFVYAPLMMDSYGNDPEVKALVANAH